MPRAVCDDCAWSFEDERQEPVVEAMEKHAAKEFHHVNFKRRSLASSG